MRKNKTYLAFFIYDVFCFTAIFTIFSLLTSCTWSGGTSEAKQDTTLTDSDNSIAFNAKESSYAKSIIEYSGALNNEIRSALQTFLPFEKIRPLIEKSISVRDSIVVTHDMKLSFTSNDSLLFRPYEIKAYDAILEYKKLLTVSSLSNNCPSLLDLTRATAVGDSSIHVLPETKQSKLFSSGDFFFLGGAPFIQELSTEGDLVYTDAEGNPEVRFINNNTENGNFILNSIYHFKKNAINITFGKPLRAYYDYPRDVNGIGSLIHNFSERIPVSFITETGIVPASIVSIELKLVPEQLGCISDQPTIEFACPKNISASEILGVFIPYTSAPINSCSVTRHSNALWTADLNADGVPDLACVSSSYLGMASGESLAREIWFLNIDGVWKIIDYANENDCT